MTYHKEEYTLHNGNKIYVLYDDQNVCKITKECIEMLLDLYQQGRADAIKELPKCKDCPNWKHSKIRPNYCQVFDWVSDAEDYCSFEKD